MKKSKKESIDYNWLSRLWKVTKGIYSSKDEQEEYLLLDEVITTLEINRVDLSLFKIDMIIRKYPDDDYPHLIKSQIVKFIKKQRFRAFFILFKRVFRLNFFYKQKEFSIIKYIKTILYYLLFKVIILGLAIYMLCTPNND